MIALSFLFHGGLMLCKQLINFVLRNEALLPDEVNEAIEYSEFFLDLDFLLELLFAFLD